MKKLNINYSRIQLFIENKLLFMSNIDFLKQIKSYCKKNVFINLYNEIHIITYLYNNPCDILLTNNDPFNDPFNEIEIEKR